MLQINSTHVKFIVKISIKFISYGDSCPREYTNGYANSYMVKSSRWETRLCPLGIQEPASLNLVKKKKGTKYSFQ